MNRVVAALVVVVAGAVGSMASVWLFAKGTYDIPPFKVHLQVKPGTGTTKLSVAPNAAGTTLQTGTASAKTHPAPLEIDATIVGVSTPTLKDIVATPDPEHLASYLKSKDQSAVKKFGITVGLASLGGGLVGGVVVSLGRWKRMLAGALVGIVLIGGLGLWTRQTYNAGAFKGTTFSR